MSCFFMMDAGVRKTIGEDGSGTITKTVAKNLGKKAGKCYEEGFNNLAVCLARDNTGDNCPAG